MLVLRGKTYYYRFWVNGKLYKGTTKKTDKAKAVLIEKELKKKIKDEQGGEKVIQSLRRKLVKSDIPLDQIFSHFLKNPNLPSHESLNRIKSCLGDFLCYLKDKKIRDASQITPNHANDYISHISQNGKFNRLIKYKIGEKEFSYESKIKNLSKRTISDYLKNLRNVFNIILKEKGILENPFNEIAIKGLKKDKESRKAFFPEELKLIGEKGKDSYLYPLFLTGISTGLREGDICKLKWQNVHLKTGWLRNVEISKTKREVDIPILPGLRSYLEDLERTDKVYVFPILYKIYMKNDSRIGKNVTKFLERIGIESNISVKGRSRKASVRDVHSLRHTFAYLAAIHNIPLPIVQSILGHMTSEMTKMYMDHAEMETKQKLLSQMPNYLHAEEIKKSISYEEINEQLLKMNEHNWQELKDILLKELRFNLVQKKS